MDEENVNLGGISIELITPTASVFFCLFFPPLCVLQAHLVYCYNWVFFLSRFRSLSPKTVGCGRVVLVLVMEYNRSFWWNFCRILSGGVFNMRTPVVHWTLVFRPVGGSRHKRRCFRCHQCLVCVRPLFNLLLLLSIPF